jgi:hypothetical protein
VKLTITIELDNDAFQPEPSAEVSRLLQECCRWLNLDRADSLALRDYNGNTVGKAVVTD